MRSDGEQPSELAGAGPQGRSPARSRVGAIVLALLAIPAIAFFWCGLPGMLGATAGMLGATILNPVVNLSAVSLSWLSELF